MYKIVCMITIVPNRTINIEEFYAPSILVPGTLAWRHQLEVLVGKKRLSQYDKEDRQLFIVRTICRSVAQQMRHPRIPVATSLQNERYQRWQKKMIREDLPVACAIGSFGIGNCGELCRLQIVEFMKKSVCCVGELQFTGEDNFEENHAAIVTGFSSQHGDVLMNQEYPIDMMLALLGFTGEERLFDPLLRSEGPLTDYAQSPTGKYNRIIGASKVRFIVLEGGPETASAIEAQARVIFQKAQEILCANEPKDSPIWDLPCMQPLRLDFATF